MAAGQLSIAAVTPDRALSRPPGFDVVAVDIGNRRESDIAIAATQRLPQKCMLWPHACSPSHGSSCWLRGAVGEANRRSTKTGGRALRQNPEFYVNCCRNRNEVVRFFVWQWQWYEIICLHKQKNYCSPPDHSVFFTSLVNTKSNPSRPNDNADTFVFH